MSLTIALGIAILIVVIWTWLGDWSGSRSRINDDKYGHLEDWPAPTANIHIDW